MRTIEDFDELVDLATRDLAVFVRYSNGPDADTEGPSMDHEAHVPLPGWSVASLDPEPWWPLPAADWVARRVHRYAELAGDGGRPWILTGRVVGTGPDHEPLVVDVEPIAWIGAAAVAEADRRFRERFDAGRDPADSRTE